MTDLQPLISIIIPTLNVEEQLHRALDSVHCQRYSNIETVVIDGGSTDATLDIIRERHDVISQWVSEPDNGIFDAMNRGLSIAKGEWVIFLGADDLLNDCVHRVFQEKMKENSVVYGDVYWKTKDRLYGGEFKWHKIVWKNVCQQAIFYPRSAFSERRFDLRYPVVADWEFNLHLWSDDQFHKIYVRETICDYGGAGTSSQMNDENFLIDQEEIVRQLFGRKITLRKIYLDLLFTLVKIKRSRWIENRLAERNSVIVGSVFWNFYL